MGRDFEAMVKGAAAGAVLTLAGAAAAHVALGCGKEMTKNWNRAVRQAKGAFEKAERDLRRTMDF